MKLPFAAVCLATAPLLVAQPSMPSWLALYPGASAETGTNPAVVTAKYTTDAPPNLVIAHYRKLFEARNLPFRPNPDGIGVTVRASVHECDLLISIRDLGYGSSVAVMCAANRPLTVSAADPMPQRVIAGGSAAIEERHQSRTGGAGVQKVYQDAPAPALIWPDWLVSVNGVELAAQSGVDAAGLPALKARYTAKAPMANILAFYRGLLMARNYAVTGGAMEGSSLEGVQYPGGAPGPRTEIRVRLSRANASEPVTVELQFTAYGFKAPRPL